MGFVESVGLGECGLRSVPGVGVYLLWADVWRLNSIEIGDECC